MDISAVMGLIGGNGGSGQYSPWPGLTGIAQGIFGNSGNPFRKGFEAMTPYFENARSSQNPFFSAGTAAIPQFQEWLSRMHDPSSFINTLMGGYQESPFAKFQQQQTLRAAQNMGSASGLSGSTPLTQFAQQNARDISSQDMNSWLQNVLGINTQYGAGLGQQLSMGQHSADILSQLEQNLGNMAGGAAYGQEYGRNQDRNSLIAGIGKLFGG